MTLAEIERVINSQKRKAEESRKERAYFDYVLANLIGRSTARVHNSSITMPSISEVYPALFATKEEQEKLEQQRKELSVLRFKLFTQSFNQRFKEVGVSK